MKKIIQLFNGKHWLFFNYAIAVKKNNNISKREKKGKNRNE